MYKIEFTVYVDTNDKQKALTEARRRIAKEREDLCMSGYFEKDRNKLLEMIFGDSS